MSEQEALAQILRVLLTKLKKTADMLTSLPPDIPSRERIKLIGFLENIIAGEIRAVSEKERAVHDLLKTLLGPPRERC